MDLDWFEETGDKIHEKEMDNFASEQSDKQLLHAEDMFNDGIDCSLLEEIIANDETFSGNSSDSGNYSPSSFSSADDPRKSFILHQEKIGDWDLNYFGNINDSNPTIQNAATYTAKTFEDPNSTINCFPSPSQNQEYVESYRTESNNTLGYNGTSMVDVHPNGGCQTSGVLPRQSVLPIPGTNCWQSTPVTTSINQQNTNPVRMLLTVKNPSRATTLVSKHPNIPNQQVPTKILLPVSSRAHPYCHVKKYVKTEPFVSTNIPVQALYTPPESTFNTGNVKMNVAGNSNVGNGTTEDDGFIRKKEDRKLRNRAAAQLSRQRKREEQEQQKTELEQARHKCFLLEKENSELKLKVAELQRKIEHHRFTENMGLRTKQNAPQINNRSDKVTLVKKAAVGVCMLMMCVVILPDYRREESDTTAINFPILKKSQQHSHGRSLLPSIQRVQRETAQLLQNETFGDTKSSGNASWAVLENGTSKAWSDCCAASLLNSTMSFKLKQDLFSWVNRHEKIDLIQLRRLPSLFGHGVQRPSLPKIRIDSSKFSAEDSDSNGKKRNNSKTRRIVRKKNDAKHAGRGSLNALLKQIRQGGYAGPTAGRTLFPEVKSQSIVEIVDGIQQLGGLEDMLYVISLRDYFLLPPTPLDKQNMTGGNMSTEKRGPPRLSVILPALSPPRGNSTQNMQLSMMRIECEVVDTSVFYLPSKLIELLKNEQVKSPTN